MRYFFYSFLFLVKNFLIAKKWGTEAPHPPFGVARTLSTLQTTSVLFIKDKAVITPNIDLKQYTKLNYKPGQIIQQE